MREFSNALYRSCAKTLDEDSMPVSSFYFLPVFPSAKSTRPDYYELYYQGRVVALVEPNHAVMDVMEERAKGVTL